MGILTVKHIWLDEVESNKRSSVTGNQAHTGLLGSHQTRHLHHPSCTSSSILNASQLHIKQFSHSEQKTQPVEHIVKTEKRTHAEWFKCYSYLGSKTSLFLWGMWRADICWELNPGFLVWAIVHYYWAMTARQQPALTILCTKCLSHASSSHACMCWLF